MLPNNYPKRILLAATGMSPQVVTETLYAITVNSKEPFIPTEIHLVTTQSGAREAKLQLLHPQTGKFWQLLDDYGLPEISFDESNIHIIEDAQGVPLDDIKTPEQNEAAADFIANIVNQMSRSDSTAIHVSIAGGRKTMGYYLGYVLSLYGRNQDRLSHVLVTDKYESLRDFFYPTPTSQVIYDRDNRALDAKDAKVMLAEIPFVRLRSGIPERLLEGTAGFAESVRFARSLESEPSLRIEETERRVFANDVEIPLSDVNYAFYLWVFRRSLEGNYVRRPFEHEANLEYAKEFLESFSFVSQDTDNFLTKEGMTAKWFSERVNAIKSGFQKAIGPHAAKFFTIQNTGNNKRRHYFVPFPEESNDDDRASNSALDNTE